MNKYGDDMTEYYWNGPEDSDEEIEELMFAKTEWEKVNGPRFSKRGIIEYCEKFLAHENANNKKDKKNAKLWEEKMTSPTLKMWLKKNGSNFSDQPYMRTDSVFNQKYQMHKLLKVIYDPKHNIKWDKLIGEEGIKVGVNEKTNSASFLYTHNRKQYTIAARDFYEKGFNFYDNGKFYRYSTSVPDAQMQGLNGEAPRCPERPNTVRAEVLINVSMMWRSPDGKINSVLISQADFKIKAPLFMINSFLPKAAKNWRESVDKYYLKNNKKM